MKIGRKYTAAIAKCAASCPGRRSPWQAALGMEYACPLGVAFCGVWDADNIIVKHRHEIASRAAKHEGAA